MGFLIYTTLFTISLLLISIRNKLESEGKITILSKVSGTGARRIRQPSIITESDEGSKSLS